MSSRLTDDLLDDMDPLKPASENNNGKAEKAPIRTPHSFLGENSNLVNLDNLIKPVASANTMGGAPPGGAFGTANPFSDRPNFFAPQPVSVLWNEFEVVTNLPSDLIL